jgi:hypothetical protein
MTDVDDEQGAHAKHLEFSGFTRRMIWGPNSERQTR